MRDVETRDDECVGATTTRRKRMFVCVGAIVVCCVLCGVVASFTKALQRYHNSNIVDKTECAA